MAKRLATTIAIPDTSSLAGFVRKGLEGWCVLCLEPVHTHVGHKGAWIGCRAPNAPMRAFLLVPDRRNRRSEGNDRPATRSATPDMPVTSPTPARAPKATRQPATLTQGKRLTDRTPLSTPRPARAPMGPQVAYTARYPVTSPTIGRIPPHDRKVYGLIARSRAKGATRAQLLDALDARTATGRVDGAVRRLRLRKVITVRQLVME